MAKAGVDEAAREQAIRAQIESDKHEACLQAQGLDPSASC